MKVQNVKKLTLDRSQCHPHMRHRTLQVSVCNFLRNGKASPGKDREITSQTEYAFITKCHPEAKSDSIILSSYRSNKHQRRSHAATNVDSQTFAVTAGHCPLSAPL